ncbi:MAG: response regulator [Vicinamibacterales bacterium]
MSLESCARTLPADGNIPTILIVNEDATTRQLFELALRVNGFHVLTASSGSEAVRFAGQGRFDVIIADRDFGDMRGVDMIRSLQDDGQRFILISGFRSAGTAVEAMKLSAVDVIEAPVDADQVVAAVSALLGAGGEPPVPAAGPDGARLAPIAPPRSAAGRWAGYVLNACEADSDLKTLSSWAQQVAVSYTTLCANCRIMRIRPLDARDFMRVLRALKRAALHRCPPEVLLDVSDARTVSTLSLRAGVDLDAVTSRASILVFLARQRFVAADNLALHLIRDAVNRW